MIDVNKTKKILKKLLPESILRAGKNVILKNIEEQILATELKSYQRGNFPAGLNLIGPIDCGTGLGQSCRLVERVIRQTGISYMIYNYSQNTEHHVTIDGYRDLIETELKYSINLWHVAPSDFAEAYIAMGKEAFDGRYNIAFWLWELEDFPDEWVPYMHLLDEIWTPSEFISRSIRKKTAKPVYTIPYHVTAETDMVHYGRKYFNLPEDKFLYLMMYDSKSVKERKNPEGVIRAFQKAFPSEQADVGLVIKVNSLDKRENKVLQELIGTYKNVYLLTDNFEKIQVNSLIASVDVLVSLHRAEGFGLVLAEAMLNHTPVIATNWSANTEFMNSKVACLVSYHMVALNKDLPPYRKGKYWADADIDETAKYMIRLKSDQKFYNKIADDACMYIQTWLGMDRIKLLVEKRIQDIEDEQ